MHRRAAGEPSAMNSPAHTTQYTESAPEPPPADEPEHPKENIAASQTDERPPSRRTRSAMGQSADNDQNSGPTASSKTPDRATDSPSVSKSTSKKRKKRRSSKSTSEESQQTGQAGATGSSSPAPAPENVVDSSSEDVETQIASQLEQDLEFAVDLGGYMSNKHHEDPSPPPVSTKKRKRDANENRASKAKDRRRSTRLSSTKDSDAVDIDGADDATHDASEPPQDASAIKPSSQSPTLRRSTRGSQRKDDELVSQGPESTQDPGQNQETPRRPSKRSRKSLNLEDQSTQAGTEESSSQAKSVRGTRSRKARSSRRESQSQSQPETEPLHDQQDGEDVVPDSVIDSSMPKSPTIPFVSTEEATDSQMTDMGSSTNVQMNMDVDVSSPQKPAVVVEQVANIKDAEYHTTPRLPQSDPSEEGIAESLKKLLGDMKLAALGPDALREVDDLLFNIRIEAHEASRRHNA